MSEHERNYASEPGSQRSDEHRNNMSSLPRRVRCEASGSDRIGARMMLCTSRFADSLQQRPGETAGHRVEHLAVVCGERRDLLERTFQRGGSRPLDDRPEIIDRVDLNPGQSGYSRSDVAGHREIDQQERTWVGATTVGERVL